ncbi:MAG: ATP-dependent helicase [Firmicutes bacterium]|nr:ATP-dependent helicase [Bacillota bacterium]
MKYIKQLKKDHNIILNKQQQQAVMTIDGATLLLAVPGSGKTTVIIARIENMIKNFNIRPEEILTLTFSVAAAKDMQNRYVDIFGNEFEGRLQFKTIHSFCYSVIKDYEQLENRKAFKVLENNGLIIKNIYLELTQEYIGEDIIKEIAQKIGYCKNMMLGKEEIEKITLPDCDFNEIFKGYEEYKRANQLMDYDDMLNYAHIILNKYKDIRNKYHNQYKYINVDEAQDTSYIQHKIIELLAQKNGNIFMVGDEDQSIYGFRAAFPKALLNFKETYNNAKVLLMEENYRSTKKIVEASNRFIKHNTDRYEKNMFCENEEGIEIKQTHLKDLNQQYKYLADLIGSSNSSSNSKGSGSVGVKSIAILYRNNDSAVPIVDILEHENIPFSIRENYPTFFSHFVTNDILYFMRLANDSSDIEAFEKIYYKLSCNITKIMLEFVRMNMKDNVFDTLLKFPNMRGKTFEKIEKIKYDFENLRYIKPLQGIEYIEDVMGYSKNLNNLAKKGYAKENLVQKLNTLKSIASNRDSFEDFSSRLIQLKEIIQNSGLKRNSVTLSTVHSSKGLEFDKVILIDLIDDQFPTKESIKQKEGLKNKALFEEETRLFYVGITRARSELEIISSSRLNNHPIKTSRFVRFLFPKPEVEITKGNLPLSESELEDFIVGKKIIHKTFGEGLIVSAEGELVDVEFLYHGTKKLSLALCLGYGIISKVED